MFWGAIGDGASLLLVSPFDNAANEVEGTIERIRPAGLRSGGSLRFWSQWTSDPEDAPSVTGKTRRCL